MIQIFLKEVKLIIKLKIIVNKISKIDWPKYNLNKEAAFLIM